MTQEFDIYNGELIVRVNVTDYQKNKIIERILKFCKENDCVSGETLYQSDKCLIEAPNVLSDILDDILDFQKEWID